MHSGIYTIDHTESGKRYIGSAVSFASRWRVHRHHLRKGTHHSPILQAAWNKHGESAFRFRPLIVCHVDDLLLFEQLLLDAYRPEYNVCGTAGNTLGYRHTEETKAKFKARTRSKGNLGKKHSDETRRRISQKKALQPSNRRGVKLSEETKQKLRDGLRGRKNGAMSEDHKAKISAANAGRKPAQRAIDASIAARKGKKMPPEAVEKRVLAYKATCAERKLQA